MEGKHSLLNAALKKNNLEKEFGIKILVAR